MVSQSLAPVLVYSSFPLTANFTSLARESQKSGHNSLPPSQSYLVTNLGSLFCNLGDSSGGGGGGDPLKLNRPSSSQRVFREFPRARGDEMEGRSFYQRRRKRRRAQSSKWNGAIDIRHPEESSFVKGCVSAFLLPRSNPRGQWALFVVSV